MHLERLNLLDFKNYDSLDLSFTPGINVITGPNGTGKTNLLDAIHFLSLTKSAFHSTDSLSIRHGQTLFSILGFFQHQEKAVRLQLDFGQGQRKTLRLDYQPYDKISRHIGEFPIVLITPYDTDLVREGSEERRKFFDTLLSQLDQDYLDYLIQYNYALKQRNSLLRQTLPGSAPDALLLENYDHLLLGFGKKIFEKRQRYLEEFTPLFQAHYAFLTEEKEVPELTYQSCWQDQDFTQKYAAQLARDLMLQRTGLGVHRDEFPFKLNGHPLKTVGSQGQQKSFVVALKLAQYELLKRYKAVKPLLLLDDIFDKLDEQRIRCLLQLLAEDTFGQVFITDARKTRTHDLLEDAGIKVHWIEMEEIYPSPDLT